MRKTLKFKWTVSRGRETYGYNICSLWIDRVKVSSCNGGGYDMKGTAFANWMQAEFQEELLKIADKADKRILIKKGKYEYPKPTTPIFYGMTTYIDFDKKETKICLDGGCGFSCMGKILNAIGYYLAYIDEDFNNTTYLLTEA